MAHSAIGCMRDLKIRDFKTTNEMRTGKLLLFFNIVIMIGFNSCSTIPKGVTAVQPFEKGKYLGKWFEIARIDFKYERDLNNTTAEYSLNTNGTIKVLNKGYNVKKREWEQAVGKAKFVGADTIGKLKVSFFGPFYSGYNVIAIDSDYKYVLVAGASFKYLWILSREPNIPDEIKTKYLKIAEDFGYNTSDLLWIEHNKQQ
ncbi:MAG TPA: lipocalin family protein [Bacteroidales bacterium]|nr:lipocalin family protein [Bacteroidales bacterium]HRZ49132.1 lipocalin family protein [Bacteroidales bacterium]